MSEREYCFRLSIGDMVTLSGDAARGDVDPQELNLSNLDRRTIEILIEILRESRLSLRNEFQVLGERLYAVLFKQRDGSENAIGRALGEALEDDEVDLLRLELKFARTKSGRGLEHWPWEYLYRPDDDFVVAQRKVILTRELTFAYPAKPFAVDRPPVQVLFVAVEPEERSGPLDGAGKEVERLGAVQWETVWDVLEELAEQSHGEIEVMGYIATGAKCERRGGFTPRELPEGATRAANGDDEVPGPLTRAAFDRMIMAWQPHVVHFIGHGECAADGSGQIALVDESGAPDWVDQRTLARTLRDARGRLRLVVLQACESAMGAQPEDAMGVRSDPYLAVSGVAAELASKGIPAVVGMNFRVRNDVANAFSRGFYDALREHAVDAAVQQGRLQVQTHFANWAQQRGFALPVLYARRREPLFPRPREGLTKASSFATAAAETTPVSSLTSPPGTSAAPRAAQPRCGKCGATRAFDAGYCRECGDALQPLVCSCGNQFDGPFCTKCGARYTPGAVVQRQLSPPVEAIAE